MRVEDSPDPPSEQNERPTRDTTGVLGALAAVLSASVTWLQVVTALRAKDLSGLSRSSWVIAIGASVLWASYGAASGSLPMLLAAVERMVLALVVLVRIVAFERRTTAAGDAVGDEIGVRRVTLDEGSHVRAVGYHSAPGGSHVVEDRLHEDGGQASAAMGRVDDGVR